MTNGREPRAIALGGAIRLCRKDIGLSQHRLAELIEVDKNYIGNIERGEHFPSIHKLCRIADVLRVKPSEIIKAMDRVR